MASSHLLRGKRILITGGTGSLGKAVVRRVLTGQLGQPAKVIVFSRDEGKHHQMRVDFMNARSATEDIAFHNFEQILEFRLGDVRDYQAVVRAVREADILINAAALKQVPSCEYFPYDAVRTNIEGAQNVVWAIKEVGAKIEKVVTISTDKACKPVNVMGMTKAIQERIFVEANLGQAATVFCGVRYGNVVASRGSVVPLFQAQIASGGPVTITTSDMTRFLISLDQAVDTIMAALATAQRGEIYIPKIPAVSVQDLAEVMIGGRNIPIRVVGIRPGEKVHEILISDEESPRTVERDKYFVIKPMLPELRDEAMGQPALQGELSSANYCVAKDKIARILEDSGISVA